MNDSSLHPFARDYLKRLKKVAKDLPRARRKELLEEIDAHLGEALPAGAGEVEALNVLERLGEPAQIVAEAESGSKRTPQARAGTRELLAVILLLFGGFLALVGWFVGLHLLWSSRIWTTRDKLIGTLLVPGGLLPGLALAGAGVQTCEGGIEPATRTHPASEITHCTPDISPTLRAVMIVTFIALILLPIISAAYISRRAGRPRVALS
jgi:hypothetical protein